MKISLKGFIYHKSAEKFTDCFDRFGVNEQTNKFAISDGVSKSFFPDIWAELLVEFFIKNEGRINLTDIEAYKSIQKEWVKRVGEIVVKPNQKYFVRNFFIQGRSAAATFVGLNFYKEDETYKWEAVALGDSFLFFVPKDIQNISKDFEKVIHLSSKTNFEFNNFPDFFDSRNVVNKGKIKQRKNELKSGTFYLMTDALAEWFISEKQNAIKIISEWSNQKDFEDSIIEHRKGNLYNDDSAILIIKIEEDNSYALNYNSVLVTDFNQLLNVEKQEIELKTSEKESLSISIKPEKAVVNTVNESLVNQTLNDSENSDANVVEDNLISTREIKKNNTEEFYPLSKEDENRLNQQKRGFWEKYVYHFLFYKHEDALSYENEHDIERNKNLNKISDNKIRSKNKFRDPNNKNKNDATDPNKPDEDVSSITDKF